MCLPLCAGSPGDMRTSQDTLECMEHHMDQINSCFQEGSSMLDDSLTPIM